MNVLVFNAGSSSLKFKLIRMPEEREVLRGIVERVGETRGRARVFCAGPAGQVQEHVQACSGHSEALAQAIEAIDRAFQASTGRAAAIDLLGHRVVHGGERFTQSVVIDAVVMEKLRECIELAPLHNPHNIKGIEACRRILPDTPQVVVFDTAFHATIPKHAYLYALPYDLYEKHRFRRYGFHGTSHYYVSREVAKHMSREDDPDFRVITCHLGNGGSITAVKGGKSIDTSMGYTPVEGLIMGTRCGDVDPYLFIQIMEIYDLDTRQVSNLMNKFSGLLGISGVSNDMRTLEELMDTDERARLAIEMFCYRAVSYTHLTLPTN